MPGLTYQQQERQGKRKRPEPRHLWKMAVFSLEKHCIHILYCHTYCRRSYFNGSDLNRKILNGNISWQGASNYCIPIKDVIFETVSCKNLTFHVFCNFCQLWGEAHSASEKVSLRCGSVKEAYRGRSLQDSLERQLHPAPLALLQKSAWKGKGESLLTTCSLLAFAQASTDVTSIFWAPGRTKLP